MLFPNICNKMAFQTSWIAALAEKSLDITSVFETMYNEIFMYSQFTVKFTYPNIGKSYAKALFRHQITPYQVNSCLLCCRKSDTAVYHGSTKTRGFNTRIITLIFYSFAMFTYLTFSVQNYLRSRFIVKLNPNKLNSAGESFILKRRF